MAAKKKAAKKKAAPQKKAAPKKRAAKKGKPTPTKVIIKQQPPIRIIVEVVVRCEGTSPAVNKFSDLVNIQSTVALEGKQYNPDDVIRIVLDVPGKFTTPVTSPGIRKRELRANLDYTDALYDILHIEIDKYVKSIKTTAEVTEDEIGECKTVVNVIDLVEKKLK